MAYDQRFAAGLVASSGEGGAKLHRRKRGEQLENLAASGEYHWMAGNFLRYAGPLTVDDLPVDAHELIALCAPRPLFISVGNDQADAWVDSRGMFMAAVGRPGLSTAGRARPGRHVFPEPLTLVADGELAFRQHEGGHTPGPNWPYFLDFASRYLAHARRSSGPGASSMSLVLSAPRLRAFERHAGDPAAQFRDRAGLPARGAARLRGGLAGGPAGLEGPDAIAAYIKGFDKGAPVEAFVGPPEIGGRFFYSDAERAVNFERRPGGISAILDEILALPTGPTRRRSMSARPRRRRCCRVSPRPKPRPVLAMPVEPRIWFGNAVGGADPLRHGRQHRRGGGRPPALHPVPARADGQPLCRAAGLHPGRPADQHGRPGGPDLSRYPRFAEAAKHGLTAELGPATRSTSPPPGGTTSSRSTLNVLVNYWWRDLPPEAGSPFEVLVHGLLAVRHLPKPQRDAWRAIFEHYLFGDEDPGAHLPPELKGVLGPLSPQLARNVRAFVGHAIGKPAG
jgi:hypothetical protein